ncbi:MAG: RNA polymerase factor sigma-54 [Enterococcus sp.]
MKFEQNFSQQQKQTQKLAMTQKLQQSIQILQFSTDELLAFVEKEALENPLIEVVNTEYPLEYSKGQRSEDVDYLGQIPDNTLSLFEFLIDQVHLNYRDTYLRSLVLYLIEYIDVNGFLTIDLEQAVEQTGATQIQMLDALTLIQRLDPAGVGARNLQECLMLQTERDDYAPALAYIVLEEHFENLVNRKWEQIVKILACSLVEVQQVFDYLQTLTPTPGAVFGSTEGLFIIPDLKVQVKDQHVLIQSNRKGSPEVRFQQKYFEQMARTNDSEVNEYLKEKQQNFDWLQKTILQRGDTILRVGQVIIQRQKAFFLEASRPLKPLILKEVAEELGIHESTVSRAVNGKYLETNFGIFELKTFFTQGVANLTESGEELSTQVVKKRLQEMVNQENKQKPLSDQKLVDLLKAESIDISRRTVAKYRDTLKIPSSSKRKRFD